jgi:hypothetical protein
MLVGAVGCSKAFESPCCAKRIISSDEGPRDFRSLLCPGFVPGANLLLFKKSSVLLEESPGKLHFPRMSIGLAEPLRAQCSWSIVILYFPRAYFKTGYRVVILQWLFLSI